MENVANYINNAYLELQRVEWPHKDEAIRLTTYVIGVSVGVGIFLGSLDYTFQLLITTVINY
ncbi:MAG: preprotein translocase subunit SecE [Patescibacteria group bacterium]|uniref:Protein translocase subunit SecE n=1 Tax=candidate division WWE3 bacterium TaxID=2053526 RepID=A0A955EDT3_UNCKA|nr:preprotein translocase subunit SecE [candidate division WWE3 bacterium]